MTAKEFLQQKYGIMTDFFSQSLSIEDMEEYASIQTEILTDQIKLENKRFRTALGKIANTNIGGNYTNRLAKQALEGLGE